MDEETRYESPFNSIPPVVLILVFAVIGVEAVLTLAGSGVLPQPGALGWRLDLVERFAVSPVVLDRVVSGADRGLDMLLRFVAYPFVHLGLPHAAFAAVMLLALGKFLGDAWSALSLIVLMLLATLAGGVAHGLFASHPQMPLVGAYPGIYGLIGGFTYVQWLRAGQNGGSRWLAFRLIGVLLGLQLVFGLMFGSIPHWQADVTGFVVGLIASPILGPGGWAHFLSRIRQR